MPRASSEDFLQNFRFHVVSELAGPDNGVDPLHVSSTGADGGIAGFQSVSSPAWSVNAVEYRDGISMFTHKQPGIPTAEDITLMRGVTRRDSSFLDWMLRYFRGNAFRADLTVYEWDQTGQPADNSGRNPNGGYDPTRARAVKLFECFPQNVKPGGDHDATSDEISLSELTVSFERFEVVKPIEDLPQQRPFVPDQ